MSETNITQCLLFPDLFRKPLVTRFDQENGSSDGGAVLLKAADRRLGLTERTIKYHMAEIIARLHLENRAQVIEYARRSGLVRQS